MPESRFGSTLRRDPWWIEILPVVLVLGGFGVYATLRAFEGKYYEWGPYLSPFYSPLIDPLHHWWPFSPALLILVGPLGFRATCYYYRKAYYRAFFLDPPACAVGESSRGNYRGETAFPFILQNVHRYFFYLAVLFIVFLWYDAIAPSSSTGTSASASEHSSSLSTSLCSLCTLFLVTRFATSPEASSTASLAPHSAAPLRSLALFHFLNERHMLFAWCSLFSVGFADFYVRMVSCGAIRDLRLL